MVSELERSQCHHEDQEDKVGRDLRSGCLSVPGHDRRL